MQSDLLEIRLSSLTTDGVCHLLSKIDELQADNIPRYINLIRTNNISGRVLMYCDFQELKKVFFLFFINIVYLKLFVLLLLFIVFLLMLLS